MQTSEQINEIAAAIAKAQSQIAGATKDKTNPHYRSKYADLASVWEACRGALTQNGLGVVQMTRFSEKDEVIVVTRLLHSSGQWLQGELNLPVSKADAQGFGSALSYARRYALAAAVGVAPEDDDGNLAAAARPATVEGRILESMNGKPITATQHAKDAFELLSPEEQDFLRTHANQIVELHGKDGDLHAYVEMQRFDTEEKLALWSILPSNVRSTFKKQQALARLGSQA